MGKIQMTPEAIRAEFKEKNNILEQYGSWLSAYEFYDLLFADIQPDEHVMIVMEKKKFKAVSLEDALYEGLGRDDVYISPATYYQDYLKAEFLDRLYAMAMDIDYVRPGTLRLIMERIRSGEIPKPTAVTNSGSGIHLYYIFSQPIQAYPRVRKALRSLYSALHASFSEGVGIPQKHWIGQPYRIVGGMTKVGDTTTAWRTGDLWKVEDLAAAIKAEWNPEPIDKEGPATAKMQAYAKSLADKAGIGEPDYSSYLDTFRFIHEHKAAFTGGRASRKNNEKAGIYTDEKPNGKAAWYHAVVPKILNRTQEGKRYSSLMALCVIAYKCRIPEEQLDKDLEMISTVWSEDLRRWAAPFNVKNVPAAKRCYHQDFLKVSREQLEEWLGWEFVSQTKRRPKGKRLKQDAHLRRARTSRNALMAMDKKDVLSGYLEKHPKATYKEITKATGLSSKTIAKYKKELP